ncbi:MAG: RHS repeat-associated core domain-containing protein [Dehalococcoidia bacterium]
MLDADGNLIARRKYWPFGMERQLSGDQRITDKWFTGQRDEDFDGLGLYNYNARMYSTLTGRFLSADPLTADGLNRYSYVMNNPARFHRSERLLRGHVLERGEGLRRGGVEQGLGNLDERLRIGGCHGWCGVGLGGGRP